MGKNIVLVFCLLVISSCENVTPNNEFTIVIESSSDLACSLPLIRFLDRTKEVAQRTSLETLTYNAYHLESSLNVIGKKLIIEFAELAAEDSKVCNTLGLGFPGIAIVKARQAN